MRTLTLVSLIFSAILGVVGWSTYNTTDTHHFVEPTLYKQVYRPFVLVSVHEGEEEIRRGSGFLMKHVEDGVCKIVAITNHHVVYGVDSLTADEIVPDLGDAVIIIEMTRRDGEIISETHLAEPARTSRFADLSMLYVPHLSCEVTMVAELAEENNMASVGARIVHMTAPGAEPGNIEVIPGYVTRLGIDPMGHRTMSTTVMIVSGMSGSPVFAKTWGGYKVVGVVKGHFTLDGVNNAGTNYIATAEELRTLIGN